MSPFHRSLLATRTVPELRCLECPLFILSDPMPGVGVAVVCDCKGTAHLDLPSIWFRIVPELDPFVRLLEGHAFACPSVGIHPHGFDLSGARVIKHERRIRSLPDKAFSNEQVVIFRKSRFPVGGRIVAFLSERFPVDYPGYLCGTPALQHLPEFLKVFLSGLLPLRH